MRRRRRRSNQREEYLVIMEICGGDELLEHISQVIMNLLHRRDIAAAVLHELVRLIYQGDERRRK